MYVIPLLQVTLLDSSFVPTLLQGIQLFIENIFIFVKCYSKILTIEDSIFEKKNELEFLIT